MAVLNSYIENGKYDLIGEVHDFNNESKKFVHESRLLNPKVFSLSESPMFEDGVVDVGALAMAMSLPKHLSDGFGAIMLKFM